MLGAERTLADVAAWQLLDVLPGTRHLARTAPPVVRLKTTQRVRVVLTCLTANWFVACFATHWLLLQLVHAVRAAGHHDGDVASMLQIWAKVKGKNFVYNSFNRRSVLVSQ